MTRPLLLSALTLTLAFFSCERVSEKIMFATGPDSTSFQMIGGSIAEIWRKAGHPVVVASDSDDSPINNVRRLERGEVEFAIAENDLVHQNGTMALSHLRAVLPLYPEVLFIIYRDDLAPTSLRDLVVGRRVVLGPRNSGSARLTIQLFEAFGIDSNEFTPVYSSFTDRKLSDSVDICCALTGFTNPLIGEMLNQQHGRLFSLDSHELANRGSSVDGFCMNHIGARPYIIPKNTYAAGPDAPILTTAVDAILLARDDVDPVLVQELVASIMESREPLVEHDHLLRGLSEKFDAGDLSFPLHAGMTMYRERHAPTFVEKNSDLFGLLLSILVAMAGAISALMKWNARRRKDRIDEYYLKAIEISKRTGSLRAGVECQAALEALHELRNDAFDKLVGEKLAADESFRIFISLVDATVGEIRDRCG